MTGRPGPGQGALCRTRRDRWEGCTSRGRAGRQGTARDTGSRQVPMAVWTHRRAFVCLNCAALSESLLESELFGHEKGAFTGATERKVGKFEAADGGTLVLDEIGEMSPAIQAKFLRVIEGHPFERVGGSKAIKVNVRVIAATNRDLEQAVQQGIFRKDLYFRLKVVEIFDPVSRYSTVFSWKLPGFRLFVA